MIKLNKSNIRTFTTRTIDHLKSTNEKFSKKIKGTIVEKWISYWKTLGKDYKEVGLSVQQDIGEKPLKSTLYFSVAAFLGFSAKLNPDLPRSKYIQSANDLGLVHNSLVNPYAAEHLKFINRCFNHNQIRYVNLGIASIIWIDKYSDECDSYESNCSYLQVPYWGVTDRIVDIGFLNVWWNISRKMLDYDINY